MVLDALLGGTPKVTIGGIELDASLEELHTLSQRVTRFPVENGATVADHIIEDPDTVRVTGQVSNHPLDFFGTLGESGRSLTAYGGLKELLKTKQLVSVETSLARYDNMVFERLEVPRSIKLGEVVRFTAVLTKLNTVQSGRVALPKTNVDAVKGKVNRGRQPAKAASPTKLRSVASKLRKAAPKLKKALGSMLGGG